MAANGDLQQKPHIAVLPTPGMGHLIPISMLAKQLVSRHGFSVTIITLGASASKAQENFLRSLPKTITSIALPQVPMDDVAAGSAIETIMSIATARSLPALRDVLRTLKQSTNLVAFLADLFGTDTFDVARELDVPPYIFFPSNFLTLSLLLHLPTFDATTRSEFRDLQEPVELPGCVPIPGSEILHPLQDRSNECYRWMVHHGLGYRKADGILVNTFDAIESGAAKVLSQNEPGRPPVFAVGPLIQGPKKYEDEDRAECLRWLDEQPRGSVLFVSFGSGGTLTSAQIAELALGLEASRQRFLWVARSPSDKETNAAYFKVHSTDDPLAYLPEGFIERTKGVGLVVPSWAPQVEVLAHDATGGFLCHCGWNSTLESVVNGVPMIAWPLYAEQRQNAVMLVEGEKVALRPAATGGGLVGKEEVSRVVKALMEGEEGKKVRSRVRELQVAAVRALADDGSSCRALEEVAMKWKNTSISNVL